jgi:hypothetical protein
MPWVLKDAPLSIENRMELTHSMNGALFFSGRENW